MANGNCSDCGEQYELDALDLDLRCADCVEQRATDLIHETNITSKTVDNS